MLKLAWISPLTRTHHLRSAAFSRMILPLVCDEAEVEVFVDDAEWALLCREQHPATARFPVFHFLRLAQRHRTKHFDCFVYQLEDTPACAFVERAMKLFPGLCCFHDLNLNRLYYSKFAHSTAATDINELMDAEFGPGSVRLGDYHVRGWSTAAFDAIYPCGRRELQEAGAVAVFNHSARRRVQEDVPHVPVCLCRTPVQSIARSESERLRREFRDALGSAANEKLIGFYASDELSGDAAGLLEEFARLYQEHHQQLRLVWGVPSFAQASFAEKVRDKLLGADSLVSSAISVAVLDCSSKFNSYFASLDLFVELRCDALRGIPQGVLAAMACAIPALVPDAGPCADIPEPCVLHFPAGLAQQITLKRLLREVLQNEALGEEMSQCARLFVRNEGDFRLCAEELLSFVRLQADSLKQRVQERELELEQAKQRLVAELRHDLMARNMVLDPSGSGFDIWPLTGEHAVRDFLGDLEL